MYRICPDFKQGKLLFRSTMWVYCLDSGPPETGSFHRFDLETENSNEMVFKQEFLFANEGIKTREPDARGWYYDPSIIGSYIRRAIYVDATCEMTEAEITQTFLG